jgi:hypothetical protein
MQLQITECFEISYFDNLQHKFMRYTRDNHNINETGDTGIKITAFLVIHADKYVDKEYGTITVASYQDNKASEEKTFNLRHNCMILVKSRRCAYKVEAKSQKVFVAAIKIGGPKIGEF